jgi:hypothetical protein
VYQIYKLLPEVYVFKNLLPNIKEQINLLKNSVDSECESFFFNDWHQWGGYDGPLVFGQYILQLGDNIEHYKQINTTSPSLIHEEKELIDDVIKAFYGATNYFIEEFNLTKKN